MVRTRYNSVNYNRTFEREKIGSTHNSLVPIDQRRLKVLCFKLKVKLKWKKFCVIAFASCYITLTVINDKKMDLFGNSRYVSRNTLFVNNACIA